MTGLLAAQLGVPMISYGCGAAMLSDKIRYSTLARTIPPDSHMAPVLALIMQRYDWQRAVIVHSANSIWAETVQILQVELTSRGLLGASIPLLLFGTKKQRLELIREGLLQAWRQATVIVLYADSELTADMLEIAHEQDMFRGNHILVSLRQACSVGQADERTQHYQGLLDLSPSIRERDVSVNTQEMDEQSISGNDHYTEMLINDQCGIGDYLLTDALLLYASTVNSALTAGEDPANRRAIASYMFNQSFTGFHGRVHVDSKGDVRTDYVVRILQNGSFVSLMNYASSSGTLLVHNLTMVWPGGSSSLLDKDTFCEWNEFSCSSDVRIAIILAGVFMGLGVVAVAGTLICRRRTKTRVLNSLQWKINFADIILTQKRYRSQFGSTFSNESVSSSGLASGLFNHRPSGFIGIGHFEGYLVAIKNINKHYMCLTNDVIREMNELCSLRHGNLNRVLGACVEPNHICVVSVYCTKGSLVDVLQNDSIRLDRIFKISFASDIAQGMVFLHESAVQYHGRLKSSNVLIDSRWTAKIADFSIRKFREGERTLLPGEQLYYYELLWTAPEHLREEAAIRGGSQKGDMYSYAMILQEILTRCPPFCGYSEDAQSVIERVQAPEHPVFRPQVLPADDTDEELFDLARICWEEIPQFRPNFATTRDSLRKLNKGRTSNLVDQMMLMMEKYTDQLEDLVDERTKQLAEEQQKTEELLCRMLPKSVADELKVGRTVAPEAYASVTIFFSDVVGFTAMAAASTPLQVVDFLNDLYTCFDAVTESYDVYKVETIGDAYMVVSGLPVRNGILHAGEICTMSLDLLSAIRSFRIRHIPHKSLQLRCGVHTGLVVAGVVGRKMPRYCLFGDTVNYASRMESSGLALRIHVSPECKDVLDRLGGYYLQDRGLVTMKGKGEIRTYFLLGKRGFNKRLPDLSMAASLEEHEFK